LIHGIKMPSDNVKSFSPKEVYFLGAGTSAIVGIPTFGDFRKKAQEICKNNLPDDMFKKILEDWETNFNEFNIEQYFAAIEMLEKLSSAPNSGDIETITSDDVKKFILSTIQKSILNTNNNNNNNNSFYEFLSRLSRIGVSHSAIVTTNWDIVLETIPQFSLIRNWINYEGVQLYNINESITQEAQFHILKLHGSLNWGYCSVCKKTYYFEEMYDSERLSEKTCNDLSCKGKLKSLVVPPTLSKLSNAESQLIQIWKIAYKYLKSCEKIYFIGYSFPVTDVEMEIFISNALRNNSKLEEVVVVSNGKHTQSKIDFEKRYRSIIPKRISESQITYHYDGFERFYEKLPEFPSRQGRSLFEW